MTLERTVKTVREEKPNEETAQEDRNDAGPTLILCRTGCKPTQKGKRLRFNKTSIQIKTFILIRAF